MTEGVFHLATGEQMSDLDAFISANLDESARIIAATTDWDSLS